MAYLFDAYSRTIDKPFLIKMGEIIKFFKENYEKDISLFELAVKFYHKFYETDENHDFDEIFKRCIFYIIYNAKRTHIKNIMHVIKKDFKKFTGEYIFYKIAKQLHDYNYNLMEIE